MAEEKKDLILTSLEDGVFVLTINRPEVRNCINPATARLMEDALNEAEKNPDVRVIVLTGAGEADHAGIRSFIEEYRTTLRGAYFINLECVGAGRPSILLEEGRGVHVRGERELVNLLGASSTAINRPLALERMTWRDTEATPLLRDNCRAVTVCGVEAGAPAHARWSGDTPERVVPEQIDDLVDILVETIKDIAD